MLPVMSFADESEAVARKFFRWGLGGLSGQRTQSALRTGGANGRGHRLDQ